MKDIKYRIWDYDLERFAEKEFDFLIKPNGDLYIMRDNKLTFFYKDFYEITIFTGLKDKNDKEIYVGDILEYKYPRDKRLKKHKSPVYFLKNEASFGITDLYNNELPLYMLTAENCEIIGNIFENPELLEEKCENVN